MAAECDGALHPGSPGPATDEQTKAVIALCDRYLGLVGLPAYTDLADTRIAEVTSAARVVAGDALNFAEAEIRRLRVAHAIVASELRSAVTALERQDIFAADNLLTEAIATAALHARTVPGGRTDAPNVVSLSVARQTRRAHEFGGL